MNDAVKIYQLYVESADANEQPKMTVDDRGTKMWWLHGKRHREDGPAVERANGHKEWWLHGKQHREDGHAIEYADGNKKWYLNNEPYADVNQWAQAVLMMRNEPHDDAAVQKYVRHILTKDDLI
jgi:hypothetical protein